MSLRVLSGRQLSQAVTAHMTDGLMVWRCRIHGWIYNVESGLVEDLVRLSSPPSLSRCPLD